MKIRGIKKKELSLTIGIIILLFIFGSVIYFFSEKKEMPLSEDFCSVDADCVSSSCCHPTSCVIKGKAPSCKTALCSQVCTPGTLDCGQGTCNCINNKCKAIFS
ncbi:MAG: hypothetical protein AABY00_01555 [Nanoarchaeota archaeon]